MESHGAQFANVRLAANRIRAATESLTNPADLAVVRQYLRELDDFAREQDAELQRRSEASPNVAPLSRMSLRGYLSQEPTAKGEPRKWTLRIDQ
jgi:hypothetical protein